MGMSNEQNSRMTCRHIPQGGHGVSISDRDEGISFKTSIVTASRPTVILPDATAIARNEPDKYPEVTALTNPVLSAQMAPPYDAFSTLAPSTILPSLHKIAAPTLNLE
jgi:hypothetical protein